MRGIENILLCQSIALTAALSTHSQSAVLRASFRPLRRRGIGTSSNGCVRITSSPSCLNGKDEDVNDLFSTYMAQRKDKPLSTDVSSPHEEDSTDDQQQQELEASKRRWSPGERLKKMLSTSNNPEPNLVQPIPLGQPKKDKNGTSTQPPNPPSLLQFHNIETKDESANQIAPDQPSTQNSGSLFDYANEIVQDAVNQQRVDEQNEIKEKSNLAAFDKYEEQMRLKFQQRNNAVEKFIKEDDPVVKEIIEEAQKNHEILEKRHKEMEDFKEYEKMLKRDLNKKNMEAATMPSFDSQEPLLSPQKQSVESISASFEQKQLEILEDLLQKRIQTAEESGFDDEDIYVTDNIEDGIEELKQKLASSLSESPSLQNISLKDWQMYRSIATKISNEKEQAQSSVDPQNESATDSDEIESKLKAWKEFQVKEEEMRAKSGLTIKYRPPFEWSNKPDADAKIENPRPKKPIDRYQAEEAATELNNLALQVLHDLMEKTKDVVRKDKLRSEIEELKESMRNRREMLQKRGPEVIVKKKVVPVMIGELLRSPKKTTSAAAKQEKTLSAAANQEVSWDTITNYPTDEIMQVGRLEEDDPNDVIPKPPDSDFFRDLRDDEEQLATSEYEDQDENELEDVVPSLGSMEEQKFRSLVARSGVRSIEGQNELQQQWEEFQTAEKLMREKAGLSIGSEASGVATAAPKVDYDVDALFKDGDIDFDQILNSIGTRPSRKKKDSIPLPDDDLLSTTTTPENTSEDHERKIENIVETEETDHISDSDKVEEIAVQNNISSEETPKAIGRGSLFIEDRTIVPQKEDSSAIASSFEQRKLALLRHEILSVSQIDSLIGLKKSAFSSDVSPYLAKMNKPFKNYGAIFRLEGVLLDVTGLRQRAWMKTVEIYDFPIPTQEDIRVASAHSEEFAILRIFRFTDDVFAARKIAETFREVQKENFESMVELMDNEVEAEEFDDIAALGIEKTDSKGTGETDEVDVGVQIDQVQHKAWERAAKSYGYEVPPRALLNIVSGLQPDEAIRSVLRWTNDYVISSDVGNTYRKYLREETSKWMKKGGVAPLASIATSDSNINISTKMTKEYLPSQNDVLGLKLKAWEKVLACGEVQVVPPTLDEIQVIEFAGLERAPTIFKWNMTPEESTSLLDGYRKELKSLTQNLMSSIDDKTILTESSSSSTNPTADLAPLALKPGVKEWLQALEDIYVPCVVISHMDKDVVDKILDEMDLDQFFPIENRISSSSGYRSESQQMLGGALRLERRPDHCVLFSATPQSAAASHEIDMKNVAMVGPYPYYELTTSDMTVRDFGSIGVRNLKNIFSKSNAEELMEQIEVEVPKVRKQTMLKTRFQDDL